MQRVCPVSIQITFQIFKTGLVPVSLWAFHVMLTQMFILCAPFQISNTYRVRLACFLFRARMVPLICSPDTCVRKQQIHSTHQHVLLHHVTLQPVLILA